MYTVYSATQNRSPVIDIDISITYRSPVIDIWHSYDAIKYYYVFKEQGGLRRNLCICIAGHAYA